MTTYIDSHESFDEDQKNSTQGSDGGALRILLSIVIGALLVGGFSSITGSSAKSLIGTWMSNDGSSYQVFRFSGDGIYWFETVGGFLNMSFAATYEVVNRQGDQITVLLKTQAGEAMATYRIESRETIHSLKNEKGDIEESFQRVGDWVLAKHPAKESESYNGERPHLGCWQAEALQGPWSYELRPDGSVSEDSTRDLKWTSYKVDYSKIPFEIDLTYSDNRVVRAIFEFSPDGSLHIGTNGLDSGSRPKEMSNHQTYSPCPKDS